MKLRLVGIASMLGVLIIGLIISVIFLNASFDQTSHLEGRDCIEVNKVASLVYDLCYDAYSKQVFIDVKRGEDSYRLTELQLSFFDSIEREYVIKEVPAAGDTESYRVASVKNPVNIDVRLGIVKDFSSPICEAPRRLFVDYCPSRGENGTLNSQLNPLNGKQYDESIALGTLARRSDSDFFSENLVDKEAAWRAQCQSKWECSDWESCYEGVQRRVCKDVAKCAVPTDAPPTNKRCDSLCLEDWECEWSACNKGYTTPTCKDKNHCGTQYSIPNKLACGEGSQSSCLPSIACSQWSTCDINYDFLDLSGGSVLDLQGIRTRTCIDSNSCVNPVVESQSCSASVDVYTKEFTKCGLVYRGIHDRLTDELLAQIRMGSKDDPSFDITFGAINDQDYCDYCYDGILNGDETGIDCGGSCFSCTDKYGPAYDELFSGNPFGAPSLIASLLNLET